MRDPKREDFEVTIRPYLRLPDIIENWLARVDGDVIRAEGPQVEVHLTGQEFLLWREIRTETDAARLAGEEGILGLDIAGRPYRDLDQRKRPLWVQALTADPAHWGTESLEDWRRQSGLLDVGVGLLGLLKSPQTRRSLYIACQRLGTLTNARVPDLLAAQAAGAVSSPWPVRSILDGASRAGLRLVQAGEDKQRWGTASRYVRFVATWKTPPGSLPAQFAIELAPQGLPEALANLLNPWLEQVRPSLVIRQGRLRPAQQLGQGGLLSKLWLQLANAVLTQVRPRLCAWERCPGPPERPGVFLWRWGLTQSGIKHRDSIYCHPLCQHAAAVARSRTSPAYRREGR
jgi:hypothetical protein